MYKHLSRPTPVSELILRINVCEAIKMITSNNITNIYQSTFFLILATAATNRLQKE